MTTFGLGGPPAGEPSELLGAQRPRIRVVPPAVSSSGVEATELAAQAGLALDPWQAFALDDTLGERADGSWAAAEAGLVVPRQNGKGGDLEARELAGLFLFGEALILHTAHQVKTSHEAFLRIVGLLEGSPDLLRRVKRINRAHGEEGVEMRPEPTLIVGAGAANRRRGVAQRLRFIARSRVSGRGFTGDCIIFDEAFELSSATMASLLPTLSARPNPQIIYTSTAPNFAQHPQSRVLARLRRRALSGDPGRVAYLEWSLCERGEWEALDPGDREAPEPGTRAARRADLGSWAATNPGLGIRISPEFVGTELGALDELDFDVERLGIGDWPPEDEGGGWEVIGRGLWDALTDTSAPIDGRPAFAVDVTPEGSFASVATAGRRSDGLLQVEVAGHAPGTAWVVPWLRERVSRWRPVALVVDPGSPAGSLIADLEAVGIEVTQPSAREVGQACGRFHREVTDSRTLRHRGDALLAAALGGARTRVIGDGAWAWARQGLSVDISPLVAVTLALWGFATAATPTPAAARVAPPAVTGSNPWRGHSRLSI